MPYRAVRVTLIGPVTAGMCISGVFGQHPCVGHVPMWYPLSQASVRLLLPTLLLTLLQQTLLLTLGAELCASSPNASWCAPRCEQPAEVCRLLCAEPSNTGTPKPSVPNVGTLEISDAANAAAHI